MAGPKKPTLRERVLQALGRVYPGLRIVDRDLEVSDSRTADVVGLDAEGRPLLILELEGEGEEDILRTIDAAVFLERNGALLRDHYAEEPDASAPMDRAPIHRPEDRLGEVALVAERFSAELLARLATLDSARIRTLEVRFLKSAAGESLLLVPLERSGPAAGPRYATLEQWLAAVGDADRELATDLVRRLERIDSELHAAPEGAGFTWSAGGRRLCHLVVRGARLEGLVGSEAKTTPLGGVSGVERFLDEVLARYVEGLELGGGYRDRRTGPPAQASLEIDSGVLLTPEELAAFDQG